MTGPTHKSTWKARERQAAAMFGAKRNRCSGSSGLAHESRSDSNHPRLFLEVKLRAKCAVWQLFKATAELARKEKKTPVVLLALKGQADFLVVVRSSDLRALIAEYAAALPEGDKDALEGSIRRAYLEQRGELEEGEA